MSLSDETLKTVRRLNRVGAELGLLFSRRDTAIELMKLALVSREHVLLLGPPGTGKSDLVARFARGVQARPFEYQLTRFTEPAELFGPVDIEAFKRGRYHVETGGMLPEAEVAFLDEVFQASSAILNTLLSLIHERVFYNGSDRQEVPLIALFSASNHLPDDPTLRAFSDRFVLRLEMEPVPDEYLGDLLAKGWDLERERLDPGHAPERALVTPEHLDHLYRAMGVIAVGELETLYLDTLRRLRAEGVIFSDRRMVKGLKLIRAAALLDGRDVADARDLWALSHMWNDPDEAPVLREVIQPLVEEAGGRTLDTRPPAEDLREEFELLEGRADDLRSDGAYTAHLGAMGQIRRQLMLHYPQDSDLLARVEGAIHRVLETMRAGV